MGTEIKTWQINNGKPVIVSSSLPVGKTEPRDLEPWLLANPEIIDDRIAIIGKQIITLSNCRLDILGIDEEGNLVIIELKGDKLYREALAQAIGYAADLAEFTWEDLDELSQKHSDKTLKELLIEKFPDVDIDSLIRNINREQRIILVGFSVDSSLERAIDWLTYQYKMLINAIVLSYVKTSSGDELLSRIAIIPEDQQQRGEKKRQAMSRPPVHTPGTYKPDELKRKLTDYLSLDRITNKRIKDVLLPELFRRDVLTHEELGKCLLTHEPELDPSKVWFSVSAISNQLSTAKNDFLRQAITYELPGNTDLKDNFALRSDYKDLVTEVIDKLKDKDSRSM